MLHSSQFRLGDCSRTVIAAAKKEFLNTIVFACMCLHEKRLNYQSAEEVMFSSALGSEFAC